MRRSILACVLVFLVIPGLAFAAEARKRAVASGQVGFLTDDDTDILLFPQSLEKHHRITLENVNPNPDSNPVDNDPGVSNGLWDGETYGAASWEMWGGTVQWGVGRPTWASRHQLEAANRLGAGKIVDPAHSAIDFGWAKDGQGFNVVFGLESQQANKDTTFRNMALDLAYGKTMASGMEASVHFGLSSIGELDGAEQGKSAFQVDAAARKELGLPFFNHWIAAAGFMKDVKVSNNSQDSAPSSIFAGIDLFNYTMAGMEKGGGEGVTYLLAIGAGFVSSDPGDSGSNRATTIQLPRATAGAEYDVNHWLTVRGSLNRGFNWTFVTDNNRVGAGNTSVTVGAGAHWGDFSVDAVVNNRLYENGPQFIGGGSPGVANYVTVTYKL